MKHPILAAMAALLISSAALAQPERVTVLGTEQDRQIAQIKYRVSELERKVSGMQKQITILHAKLRSKE